MVDCGNVNELDSLEQLIRDLSSLPHSMIVVVGGTEEMNLAIVKGSENAVSYLKVDSSLDMKPGCVKQEYKDGPVI